MAKAKKDTTPTKNQAKKQNKKPISKTQQPISSGGKPPSPVASMLKHREGPKWSLSKLAMGQFLSMTSYMTVVNIPDTMVSVKNQHGHHMQMSKELLGSMYSATHYACEVTINMTGLAELLQSVQDVVFTVNFKKQVTESSAAQLLLDTDAKDFEDPKKMLTLAKSLLKGENCALTCHMVEVETNLGRSLVIDLNSSSQNKFRQVDHRTIDSIIFKNVKYALGRGGINFSDIEQSRVLGKDEALWDTSKLEIGNIFSGTSYYETVSELGDREVFCYEKNMNNRGVTIRKEIMRDEMYNANTWDSEEQITRTQLAERLTQANATVVQVCFTCKPSENGIKEILEAFAKAPVDSAEAKLLAKECLTGKESTLVCRLSKAEGKLGRSTVIDVPSQGYRQVDHRTIKWLVMDNVKFTTTK